MRLLKSDAVGMAFSLVIILCFAIQIDSLYSVLSKIHGIFGQGRTVSEGDSSLLLMWFSNSTVASKIGVIFAFMQAILFSLRIKKSLTKK